MDIFSAKFQNLEKSMNIGNVLSVIGVQQKNKKVSQKQNVDKSPNSA